MSRIQEVITARRAGGRIAFVPFLTAGFPDPETSIRTAVALARVGADVLEIGIPFSDPIADGPVIQQASAEALARGMTAARTLELVAQIRTETPVPVVLMTYLNPVMQFGEAGGRSFADAARAAGVEGLLITDLPPDQPHEIWEDVAASGLAPILLISPTTTPARLATISARAQGFIYCVARLGVTGSGRAHAQVAELAARARAASGLPVVVGFGITDAEAARAMTGFADGVVVGSALLAAMRDAADPAAAAARLARDVIAALATR